MRNFPKNLLSAIGRQSNALLNLVRIDVPANGVGAPALVLRLTTKSSVGTPGVYSTGALSWYAIIEEIQKADGLLDATTGLKSVDSSMRITVGNLDSGLFSPPGKFQTLFQNYDPEKCEVTVYQWADGEGLAESDLDDCKIFAGFLDHPARYNPRNATFRVIQKSNRIGKILVGNRITVADYPDAPGQVVGKVKPIPYGFVKNIQGLPLWKTIETVLSAVVVKGQTVIQVADTSEFPASGDLIVNGNEIAYTGSTASTFTGITGIARTHYKGNVIYLKRTEYPYLFADPAYPVSDIKNPKVEGHLIDSSLYTVDVPGGKITLNQRPQYIESINSEFAAIEFDVVGPGNTAIDPLNANDPDAKTVYAEINQGNPKLSLTQNDVVSDIGDITTVLIRVEHFEEEKLPNDELIVEVEGDGIALTEIGRLSRPSADDKVSTAGSGVDFTLTHLDDLGFPVSESPHLHSATATAQRIVDSGDPRMSLSESVKTDATLVPASSVITFPAWPIAPGGIDKAEYWASPGNDSVINISGGMAIGEQIYVHGRIGVSGIGLNPGPLHLWQRFTKVSSVPDVTNIERFEAFSESGQPPQNIMSFAISHNMASASISSWSFGGRVFRRIVTQPGTSIISTTTGAATNKQGQIFQHTVDEPVVGSSDEKASKTVVEFFAITDLVAGDWSKLTNLNVIVRYSGTLDGRSSFIIHTGIRTEYVFKQIAYSDQVTADVDGAVDPDGSITGTPGQVMERPDHLQKHGLVFLAGQPASIIATDQPLMLQQSLIEVLGGLSGFSCRQVIPAALVKTSSSKMRLELRGPPAGTGENCAIDQIYIGHLSSIGQWNFQGAPVQVLFSGSPSTTVNEGATLVSDIIDFTYELGRDVLVAFDIADPAGTDSLAKVDGITGAKLFVKAAANDAAAIAPSGFSESGAGRMSLVASIKGVPSFESAGWDFENYIHGGYKMAGVITEQTPIRDLQRAWGKQSRSILYFDLGKAHLLTRSLASLEDSFRIMKAIPDSEILMHSQGGKDFEIEDGKLDDLVNTVNLKYLKDFSNGEYLGNANDSLEASVSRFGAIEKQSEFDFDWINHDATAQSLASFWANELGYLYRYGRLNLFAPNLNVSFGDRVGFKDALIDGLGNAFKEALVIAANRQFGIGRQLRPNRVELFVRFKPEIEIETIYGTDESAASESFSIVCNFQLQDGAFIDVSENFSTVSSFQVQGSEAVEVLEAFVSEFINQIFGSEQISVSENFSTLSSFQVEDSESVVAAETFNVGFAGQIQSSEVLTAAEIDSIIFDLNAPSETIEAAEVFQFQMGNVASEGCQVSEGFSSQATFIKSSSESVSVLENYSIQIGAGWGKQPWGTSKWGG